MDTFLFWFFSVGMLLSGLAVITNRNPVTSALSLVGVILFMAGLYVLLNAFFLAAIQVLVYAGAVMVLFLFIIMLLDLKAEQLRPRNPTVIFSGLVVGALLIQVFYQVIHSSPNATLRVSDLVVRQSSDIPDIGRLLFSSYLLPFEVTSILLLIATIGVVLLTRKENK